MTVLEKLKKAFPGKYEKKKVYTAFKLRQHATIYVDHNKDNLAKIRITACKNFPYGDNLRTYIRGNNVPVKESGSHPDAKIDNDHIDAVIDILLGKNKSSLTTVIRRTGSYLPTKEDVELAAKQISKNSDWPIDLILDQVKKNALADGKQLKPNWRMKTEENIKIWFK